MKHAIYAVMMAAALFGCEKSDNAADSVKESVTEAVDSAQESATEAMDKVQETASEATEVVQEQMDAMQEQADSVMFDFEQLAATSEVAKAFSEAVKEAMNVDFSDSQAVESATNSVANTYQCFVESTSETEADSTVSGMMASMDSDEVKSLIENAIEYAKASGECVM